MYFKELGKEANDTAKDKGWYDEEIIKTDLECHMLIVSEIAEASEEIRKGLDQLYFVNDKPKGESIELADAIIRIADYAFHKGIDLDRAIQLKLDYNKTRPFRHGGKLK